MIAQGLSEEQCAAGRKKARVLYLSLAETTGRLLATRLDDRFYGLKRPWLNEYIQAVDRLSCKEINEALRLHLAGKQPSIVIVTDDSTAPKIAEQLVDPAPIYGKGPKDYRFPVSEESGVKRYSIDEEQLSTLRKDAVWAAYPLGLSKERIRRVGSSELFLSPEIP